MLECKISESFSQFFALFNGFSSSTPEARPASEDLTNETALRSMCAYCEKQGERLLQCSRCKRVKYCSKDCQRAAWKIHKIACNNAWLIPENDEIVCRFQNSEGLILPLTQKEFREKLAATFVHRPLYSKDLRKYPRKGEKTEIGKLQIIDKAGLVHQGELMQHGLVALQDIKCSEPICHFGGEAILARDWQERLDEIPHKAKVRSISGGDFMFNPSEYASLAAFINDGPPNCELVTDHTLQVFLGKFDIPVDTILTSAMDIKKGEPLFFDYGPFHPVKRGIYELDKNTLKALYAEYGSNLDVSPLGKSGWILSSIGNLELMKTARLQYILCTPYVLTMLHLNTSLNPLKTLKDLQTIEPKILDQFKGEEKGKITEIFSHGKVLLNFIAKIKNEDKQKFSELFGMVSQHSLLCLCTSLREAPLIATFDECRKFCLAFDKMKLRLMGTLAGCYWDCGERTEFEKLFFSEEYKKHLFDSSDIKNLHPKLVQGFFEARQQLFLKILPKLTREQQEDLTVPSV